LDPFALIAGQYKSLPLSSQEMGLRKAASNERVEYRGTLWLLDAMIEEDTISGAKGHMSLGLMLNAKRRLQKKRMYWLKWLLETPRYSTMFVSLDHKDKI